VGGGRGGAGGGGGGGGGYREWVIGEESKRSARRE